MPFAFANGIVYVFCLGTNIFDMSGVPTWLTHKPNVRIIYF